MFLLGVGIALRVSYITAISAVTRPPFYNCSKIKNNIYIFNPQIANPLRWYVMQTMRGSKRKIKDDCLKLLLVFVSPKFVIVDY